MYFNYFYIIGYFISVGIIFLVMKKTEDVKRDFFVDRVMPWYLAALWPLSLPFLIFRLVYHLVKRVVFDKKIQKEVEELFNGDQNIDFHELYQKAVKIDKTTITSIEDDYFPRLDQCRFEKNIEHGEISDDLKMYILKNIIYVPAQIASNKKRKELESEEFKRNYQEYVDSQEK